MQGVGVLRFDAEHPAIGVPGGTQPAFAWYFRAISIASWILESVPEGIFLRPPIDPVYSMARRPRFPVLSVSPPVMLQGYCRGKGNAGLLLGPPVSRASVAVYVGARRART